MKVDDSAINEFLKQVTNGIVQAQDFATAQLPDIAQQAIRYNIAINSGCLIFTLIGFAVCLWGHLSILRKFRENDRFSDVEFLWLPLSLVVVFNAMGFFASLSAVLKLWLAPKVWIIEYMGHLVRG